MAESKEYILTVEGKAKLEEELDRLVSVTRKEVSEKIKEARSFGDLSENAEYDAAKDEQAEVEARISQIEHMLKILIYFRYRLPVETLRAEYPYIRLRVRGKDPHQLDPRVARSSQYRYLDHFKKPPYVSPLRDMQF